MQVVMGIPSYYKKLLDTLPDLIQHQCQDIDWLFMDFNCLIYHCLHHAPPYLGHNAWELEFLECIVTYCHKVINKVASKKGVYIAIDGVVPMAKMRQQRLRRFKSAWLSKQDRDTVSEKWDTNAITPGTLFMTMLRTRLETMISEHSSWTLSSSDEPGEGEHKIMTAWRTGSYQGNIAVYGLDADLIVLSLLGSECCPSINNIWLFREEVVAGTMTYDAAGEEIFEWFSIIMLRDWLTRDANDANYANYANYAKQFIIDYCFAMSVLGNDFLPGSLGLKIRDDGHTELLRVLRLLSSQNNTLIDIKTLEISVDGVMELFNILSQKEGDRIGAYISKKQMFARQLIDVPLVGDPAWPLYHMEESILLESKKQLIPSWKETYLTRFFPGVDKDIICKEYLYGIQWIWAYYTGRAERVCFNWYYPYSLPPLWEWLSPKNFVKTISATLRATDIKPVEQLAVVLPLESWSLIPPCRERQFPLYAPHFFPSTFSFESVGKRFFWECEPLIPLPSIMELKMILHTTIE